MSSRTNNLRVAPKSVSVSVLHACHPVRPPQTTPMQSHQDTKVKSTRSPTACIRLSHSASEHRFGVPRRAPPTPTHARRALTGLGARPRPPLSNRALTDDTRVAAFRHIAPGSPWVRAFPTRRGCLAARCSFHLGSGRCAVDPHCACQPLQSRTFVLACLASCLGWCGGYSVVKEARARVAGAEARRVR